MVSVRVVSTDRSASQDQVNARTLGQEAFERIRADILNSTLPPGTRLRFDDLRKTYGFGLAPLREALSRLAENRLVVAVGQRGFWVPDVSVAEIRDIAMVRTQIESWALRLSIRNGDDQWEADVVAARHKLALLERTSEDVSDEVWERRHRDFHFALVSASQSPSLLHLLSLLNDLFDRYRRLSVKTRLATSARTLVHHRICEAVLARDAERAEKVLAEHIHEATELIVAGLRLERTGKEQAVQQS